MDFDHERLHAPIVRPVKKGRDWKDPSQLDYLIHWLTWVCCSTLEELSNECGHSPVTFRNIRRCNPDRYQELVSRWVEHYTGEGLPTIINDWRTVAKTIVSRFDS